MQNQYVAHLTINMVIYLLIACLFQVSYLVLVWLIGTYKNTTSFKITIENLNYYNFSLKYKIIPKNKNKSGRQHFKN